MVIMQEKACNNYYSTLHLIGSSAAPTVCQIVAPTTEPAIQPIEES